MACPIKTETLDKSTRERIIQDFPPSAFHDFTIHDFVKTKPGNCLLPEVYTKYMERIYNMELRSDDIFVLCWPKCGTTWTQEMVWCIANDYDIKTAKSDTLDTRVPYLEFDLLVEHMKPPMKPKNEDGTVSEFLLDILSSTNKSPRIFKSHLPFCLLPPKLLETCKVVMCLRNPRDAVVSYYHNAKLIKIHGYTGDFETYANYFMEDLLMYSPYWEYVLYAWSKRNHPNICLNFFEDMKRDLTSVVRKTSNFLGKEATNEQIHELVDHLSFKNMQVNPFVNKEEHKIYFEENAGTFFRKGEVGNWKEYFSPELNEKMNKWIEERLRGTDLNFTYEL